MKVFFFLFFAISGFSQQTEIVDFNRISASVTFDPEEKSVKGDIHCEFTILSKTDSIFLDAKNMQFHSKKSNSIQLRGTAEKLWFVHPFEAGKTYTVRFSYAAEPKQTLYFVGWENGGSNQIWTQGQGKETSHWLPSIDDLTEKIEFDLSISAPEEYRAIANGKFMEKLPAPEGMSTWKFDMIHPMSSYLVALAVGDFREKTLFSDNGVPIKLYFEAKDSLKVEPTYRYSKEIFDFLEKEIGVAFPWQNHKQVPVRDFLYAGMENTTLTIFSEAFVIDSTAFVDRNYVNVNAHELAHQWFGDLVTQASGEHHWLHEGFATYYALLAEREIFGDDYYYFKLYTTAEQLKARSDLGKGESLLNSNANSLTFYQKGAWALHILREKIGGEAFRDAVKNFLQKYQYATATTSDFISEAEKSSGMVLTDFVEKWLKQSAFQANIALNSLEKSSFMVRYLDLAALRSVGFQEKKTILSENLNFPVNTYLGQEVVFQLANEAKSGPVVQLYKKAFATNDVLTRQAIAHSVDEIPAALKTDYVSLLKDPSYLTQEKAMLHLWFNFPTEKKAYLEEMAGAEGFSDKNIELLWLTLNLVTSSYQPAEKQNVYAKLSGYTSPEHAYPVRENAFGYLYQINRFTPENYQDLLQGNFHPVWRFRKFCGQLLDELLKDPHHREQFKNLLPGLPEKQMELLNKKMS